MAQASSERRAREARRPSPSGPPLFADALCAIDGTPESVAAVEQAASLAGSGGRLTLLTATAFRTGGQNRSPAIGPARAKEITDHATLVARNAGVSSVIEVDPDGSPPAVILGWADGRDLLALGAPPTSLLGSRFVRGVADAALGAFTTPMLVARPTPRSETFGRTILVASDGMNGSDELVALAGRLARALGAEARVVHAAGARAVSRTRRVQQQARSLGDATGGSGEALIESRHARAVIAEIAASEGASLVVMGSRRPRGLAMLGSVSAWYVHEGPCSVLIMPAEALGS
jgi:nucleotide-binding universal stress UspA family protein